MKPQRFDCGLQRTRGRWGGSDKQKHVATSLGDVAKNSRSFLSAPSHQEAEGRLSVELKGGLFLKCY
ncbi:MAG: hypothetical protein ABSA27_00930 [Terriglobales bacterium]